MRCLELAMQNTKFYNLQHPVLFLLLSQLLEPLKENPNTRLIKLNKKKNLVASFNPKNSTES